LKKVFGASTYKHPFKARKPQNAIDIINKKVSEATDGKIKDLMPSGND